MSHCPLPHTQLSVLITYGGTQGKAPAVSSAAMDGGDEQTLPMQPSPVIFLSVLSGVHRVRLFY